jgi:hypothetical protein
MGKQTELLARHVKDLLHALAGQGCFHTLEDIGNASESGIHELRRNKVNVTLKHNLEKRYLARDRWSDATGHLSNKVGLLGRHMMVHELGD